jgi:hypothetical protein
MHRNVFAYTAPGAGFPEYLSVNRLENGRVRVTVRARRPDGVGPGLHRGREELQHQARLPQRLGPLYRLVC